MQETTTGTKIGWNPGADQIKRRKVRVQKPDAASGQRESIGCAAARGRNGVLVGASMDSGWLALSTDPL